MPVRVWVAVFVKTCGGFFCLSHTRWFDEVLVTLLPSLGDGGESEKL